ncbi:MAG: hypothetical protein CXR30_14775 [Geobacter sp.]|nr:MAG: hypothetical protein CXR30_14775 [Geobacter sp.]
MNELIRILTQFGGGRGGGPNNDVVRFLLAAFFWCVLSFIASREWRRENKRRDLYVGLAALLGLCREILMFTAEYGSYRGVVSFDFMYRYYPPLEHAATMLSCIVIAFAFLQQVRINSRFAAWYLWLATAITATIYLVTAVDWQRYLVANPGTSFGLYGGDLAFRLAASLIMATALAAFICARQSGKFVPKLLLLGFSFFLLDDLLMILNLVTHENLVSMISPIRHNFHIWAIPLLTGTYWAELHHRIKEAGNFAYAVIDALSAQICVLDNGGNIIAVNRSWRMADLANLPIWLRSNEGDNYFKVCEETSGEHNDRARDLTAGIRSVMDGSRQEFSLEYHLFVSGNNRWFQAKVTRFSGQEPSCIVIAHEDITDLKLAEEDARLQGMQLLTLHRVSEITANADNQEDAFHTIVAEIAIATRFPMVAIEMCDRDRQVMIFKGSIGFSREQDTGHEIPLDRTPAGIVVRSGEPLVETHVREHPEYDYELLTRHGIQTFVCVPMISSEQVIGTICLANPAEIPVNEQFVNWMASLANSVAAMIERKQAEDALRYSEERYRSLVENMPVGITMVNNQYRIVMVNQTQADLFRRPAESFVGHHCFELFEKREQTCPHCPGATSMNTAEIARVDTEGIRDDGSRFTVRIHAVPIFDAKGAATGFVEVVEDITERKQAEDALRYSEARLIESQRVAGIGHYEFHIASGTWTNSKELDNIFGIDEGYEKDVQGWLRIVHPDDRQAMSEYITEQVIGAQRSFNREYRIQRVNDQATRWVHGLGQLEFDGNGDLLLMFGTIQDITDWKLAEQQRSLLEQQILHTQKLESLGVLAGGIAHDFNNILLAIMGHAELALMRLNPTSPARDNLLKIEQSSQRAAELARQMLAYSGKGKFIVEPIDLGELVTDMTHMLEVSISKKAILRINLASNLPPVEADATQLRQVLMNLVINASEAIGEKSGVIAITTGAMQCDRRYLAQTWINEQLEDGFYVYVEVADTGCGMDKETLARIFDPFFTTKFTGRGLGMAAVLGIVRGHHGAIKAYSEQGKGTTFKMLLPAAAGHFSQLRKNDVADKLWHGSGTILLVDDEETIRALGSEMLKTLGFQVVTADDGRQAIDIYRQRQEEIAAVILDLTMPHMDGEEAFRELRRIRADVRVVMSSGYNEMEVSQRFLGKRLAGFIQKPYKLAELSTILKQAMEA